MSRLAAFALLLATLASPLAAQTARKPITQDVYDRWRTISGASLSPDGGWAAYTLSPVVGDGEVVVRATTGGQEFRVPRGYTGRPNNSTAADSAFSAPPAQFTADGRYLLFAAYAPRADFDRARRSRRAADQPRAALTIVDLATGAPVTVPRVRSFRAPRASGRYVVYLLEPADTTGGTAGRDSAGARPPGAAAATPGGTPRPIADSAARGRRKEFGSTLVIRELATGNESRIDDVLAYAVDDSARWVAYTVSSRDGAKDGAYARSLGDGSVRALLSGQGSYKQLVLDRAGTQVAFVSDREEHAQPKPRYALYHAALRDGRATAVVPPGALGDVIVADRGRVEFTRDGSAILFGVVPPPLDSIPADSLADKAVFDLWHWKDSRLQPQQRADAARDRDRSHAALFQLRTGKLVRLANDSMPNVSVSDDGRVGLAVTNVPYSIEQMWGDGGSDVHVIDIASGRRATVARKVPFNASLSPAAKYVVWFDDGRWWSYATGGGKTVDLTGALKDVRFDQETWDTPSTPAPWGVAGWTKDDRSVLIYSRYDIWDVDPTGARAPRVVTDSLGVRSHLVLRVVDLDPEERYIDPARPVILRAFDEETKASGFYRDRLGVVAAPEKIVMADAAFGAPQKARKTDVFMVTRSTVADFPNLWVGGRLDQLARISDANPEQRDYPWPSAELVRWRSNDGVELSGILYKPEGFDGSRQYPMVVYYYEQLSDNLHQYHAPAGRNTVNPTVYTSLGYLVFFPDIAYTEGYPGPSALHSIVPGVQSLIARGFVNPKAIGLAGQSWGGYQTAYIVTQTNMFAAGVPNATVANMTSAYGGIRWESGVARAFQYEKTQSRIGGSLWEYPMRYIENSPLFYADRIQTPLLFMANDADGAVPWYQGIEFFVALRRHGKEAYMINYNGDAHNPRKRANQKDIDMRMQQFFAHHLKGEPAPDWMVRGIPYLQKGRDQVAPAPVAAGGTGAPVQPQPQQPHR